MKKVLSLVLAAAMTMGIAATAFATMNPDKKDTTGTPSMIIDGTNYVKEHLNDPTKFGVGTTGIGALKLGKDSAWEIPAGASKSYTYHVVAVANEKDAKGAVITYNHWNFTPSITVKGPAEVSKDEIDKDSFRWWTVPAATADGNGVTYLSFDVKFTLKATNYDATDYKGLRVKYGVSVKDVANRSGLKGDTTESNGEISVGYSNEDIEDLYDDVVNAFDDMRAYDEKNFDVTLKGNPVLPSSIVRFLARNLGNDETATFVINNDDMTSYNDENATTYFKGNTTLTLNKKAFTALNNGKHINVATNSDEGPLADALADVDFDYNMFNFVTHRPDVIGVFSVEYEWNKSDAHVYLVNDDGTLEPVELKDSENYAYGDVLFEGPMTRYLITDGELDLEAVSDTDEPIEDDDLIDEPVEDDDKLVDEDGNPIENNPGTGSSNAISLAVAMAVVSLAAAGLVASKKASK